MKTLTVLTSAIVLAVLSTQVVADDASAPKSLTVQFADLNLEQDAGAAALFNRIRSAAKAVCAGANGGTLRQKQAYETCVEFALSNTIARVDQPVLTQYVLNRSNPEKAPTKIASAR